MPETHHIYNINTYNININTGEEPQPGDEIGSD
jgi:hypothetical protein